MTRTRGVLVLVGVVLAAVVGALIVVFGLGRAHKAEQAPELRVADPRLDYAGPFQNVDPNVQYVSDSRCGDCHVVEARTYALHPMARALLPVSMANAPPHDAQHKNPFEALGSSFRIEADREGLVHRRLRLDASGQPAATLNWDVQYVIGSGARGHSYLAVRDGFVHQTPISWYEQKKQWDLSPGFALRHLTGRSVGPDCLFCHTNGAKHVEGSVNKYSVPLLANGHGIGCQRCHGPGELHVAAREDFAPVTGTFDNTIVNPRHLEWSSREAVCEQCHLEGVVRIVVRNRGLYDFRPGLPLEQFWSVFDRVGTAGDRPRAVGHVEQMYESRCFQGSGNQGRLGCISCHDPHRRVEPEQRVAYFRNRCLQCHRDDLPTSSTATTRAQDGAVEKKPTAGTPGSSCSLLPAERLVKGNSCIDCHMPRYGPADVPHTAATDHKILRWGKRPARAPAEAAPTGGFPIVSFYRERSGVDPDDDDRAQALGVMKLALGKDAAGMAAVRLTLPAFDAALRRDPADIAAGEGRAYALAMLGRNSDALAAFESVLTLAPNRELSLVGAASAAEAQRQIDVALGYCRRAVALNPYSPGYRSSLATLLAKKEAWAEAASECQAWVQLDPLSPDARTYLVTCLLANGNKSEARAEFAKLEGLSPPNLHELRIRFQKRLK